MPGDTLLSFDMSSFYGWIFWRKSGVSAIACWCLFLYPYKTNVFGGILESACLSICLCVSVCLQNTVKMLGGDINPFPYVPISGSSNSAANKDMMSKIWTNGDTIFLLSRKHCRKRWNCLLFPKAVCCWWIKMSICGVKGLVSFSDSSSFIMQKLWYLLCFYNYWKYLFHTQSSG